MTCQPSVVWTGCRRYADLGAVDGRRRTSGRPGSTTDSGDALGRPSDGATGVGRRRVGRALGGQLGEVGAGVQLVERRPRPRPRVGDAGCAGRTARRGSPATRRSRRSSSAAVGRGDARPRAVGASLHVDEQLHDVLGASSTGSSSATLASAASAVLVGDRLAGRWRGTARCAASVDQRRQQAARPVSPADGASDRVVGDDRCSRGVDVERRGTRSKSSTETSSSPTVAAASLSSNVPHPVSGDDRGERRRADQRVRRRITAPKLPSRPRRSPAGSSSRRKPTRNVGRLLARAGSARRAGGRPPCRSRRGTSRRSRIVSLSLSSSGARRAWSDGDRRCR